ncbi:MAG: ATP-binding protein [Ignavibacteria bacterium]|nr:ATP-binding protein [Ignavibacteria bacterium]
MGKQKKIFTHREFMEMAVGEMKKSISEHDNKPDPKVGAVLVSSDGRELVEVAHRGEIRSGDHAEFILLDKKLRTKPLTDYILYTTLEPCVERNPPKSACVERTVNARIKKVFIGIQDPHPSVAGEGIKILNKHKIDVEFFDADLAEEIRKENKDFINYAEEEAKKVLDGEIAESVDPLDKALENVTMDDFSLATQEELINRAELKYKVGSKDFNKYLLQLSLIKTNTKTNITKPTGLGLLLFGKNPQLTFTQARVQFFIHQTGSDDIIENFDGPVLLQPQKIQKYLDIIYPKYITRKTMQREEYFDVPIEVIRETINNAIAHRDYTITGATVKVYIYDDRVEVYSPGKPIHPLDKFDSFSVPPESRNPKIAYLFNEISVIEELGLGMRELKKLSEIKQLPKPTFRMNEQYFVTTIYTKTGAKPSSSEINEKLKELNSKENQGFENIRVHGNITSSEYRTIMNVSGRTARNHLKKMVDLGLLKVEGEGKATKYVVIN